MTRFEFWPDYGPGPLWTEDGKPVPVDALGLPTDLAERLRAWNAKYDEDKIPVDGPGDVAWLEEGKELLRRTREALGPHCRVVVTEPWWGEAPAT